ncbi:hypothetical protein QL285_033103 [Trifolium repens]|nr:hypothetical protein QL285_033103 [Trifolium repens]
MDIDFQRLYDQPKGNFSTVLIHNQFYGEVEPKFVEDFQDELKKDWHIWDQDGKHHTLTFTMHHIVPYLTDGWFVLCQDFKIEQLGKYCSHTTR